ncbi:MAG: ABC transporter substrate-binding protein [Bacillota bacterium]
MNKNSKILFIVFALLIGAAALILINNMNKEPISIGFVAQLTGKQAELGVQERNGVQLAVEMINESGGIHGRMIELVVRDDLGVPEGARAADKELIDEGVIAIIGHATSGQTAAGLETTNPADVVLLSPTVSTPKLSGIDDNFVRVYPSFKESAEAFAEYTYQGDGIKRLAIIYDGDNAAYSKTYSEAFAEKFRSLDGTVTNEVMFSSVVQPNFQPLLAKLSEDKPNGLLIIASDIDTALIAQRTRLMDWSIPLYTSAWAQTETLISNGGQAVEGLKLEQSYALTSETPIFLDFKARYEARFGGDPSFGAAFGYEAAQVLAEAMKKTGGSAEGLKEALLSIRDFQGVIDTFSIDRFGDVERPFYLSSIHNGKFVVLEKLTLSENGEK